MSEHTQIIKAVLDTYRQTKVHLMPELPDRTPVQLLVKFRLGDLREFEKNMENVTILSGG